MFTSFASLTYCTFEYNLNIDFEDKFSTGLKAIPLYAICALYKCLSICTMIALLRFYAIIPIFIMYTVLVLLVYFVSGSFKSTRIHLPRSSYLALFTMPIFHPERSKERDLLDAPDSVYLKWFQWEAFTSFLLHTIVLGSLALLWQFQITTVRNNYPGAMVWPWETYIHDCANQTVKLHVPLVCLIIIAFAFLHFICTLFYVHHYPHVWNLRQSTEGNIVDERESNNSLQLHRISQNQFVAKEVLPNLTDFERYRAQCGEARSSKIQHRLVLSPVRHY